MTRRSTHPDAIRMNALIDRRKAAGLCPHCGLRPPEESFTRCRPCLDYNNSQTRLHRDPAKTSVQGRELRLAKKAAGICPRCKKRPAEPGHMSCRPCLEYARTVKKKLYTECVACGSAKPLGRSYYCRACNTAKAQAWAKKRGPRIRLHCSKCKQPKRENTVAWCDICMAARRATLEFKLYVRQAAARYRAAKKVFGNIDYVAIARRDTVCYLCRLPINERDLSFDHVVPVSKGGRHAMDNIRATHLICNKRKSDKLLST